MPSPPVRLVYGNLVAARSLDDIWAGYRLKSHSYLAEPQRRKAALALALREFARTAQADLQVLRVTRPWDTEAYLAGLRGVEGPTAALWRNYLDQLREGVGDVTTWTPSTWLFVRLGEPSMDPQARASRLFERSPREILASARLRRNVMLNGSLDVPEVWRRLSLVNERVLGLLDARPATSEEVQWLLRRPFCRGVGEPPIAPPERFSTPYEEAERSVVRFLSEDAVEPQYNRLRVIGGSGEHYQSVLCVGEVKDATPFSRQAELMFGALESYPWPLDACLSVRWVPNDQAKRRVARRFARSTHQLHDEEATATGAMDDSYRRRQEAYDLHAYLEGSGDPLLMGSLSFAVSAPDVETLDRRVLDLRQTFPWALYRPLADQLDAFLQHLPAQSPRIRGMDRAFTCEQVGAMVPQGAHQAGSDGVGDRALYVGRTTRGRQPTLFDLSEGSDTNKAPTIAMIGTLGGGKTMALQLLLYQGFLQGGRVIDVDPKGDHRLHLHPDVAPYARTIVLGPSPEHAGRLDPLRNAPASERHDAAASFLVEVLPPGINPGVEAAISGSITRVMDRHGERACCMEVVADLEGREDEDSATAGRWLRQFCRGGLARLGFARLGDPLPSRGTERYTYLQIRALKRAADATPRSEMTQAQRHGRAVLHLVVHYTMRIHEDEHDVLKLTAFDEASFLGEDAAGHQAMDQLQRWARSERAVPIVSSQLLADVRDQDNLIGHWFVFAMRSPDHARHALETLDRDVEGPLVQAMTTYENGCCLYRDLRGRCEEFRWDLGRHGLLEFLSTRPKDRDLDRDRDDDHDDNVRELAEAMKATRA